jgi:hypothetical protein
MMHPHELTKYQRRFPLHYHYVVQALADDREWKRGRRDLDFVIASNKRVIKALVEIYDLCCLDEAERKRIRETFRKLTARQGGRLAPYYDELHRTMRSRLREHKLMVRCGLDRPDETRST